MSDGRQLLLHVKRACTAVHDHAGHSLEGKGAQAKGGVGGWGAGTEGEMHGSQRGGGGGGAGRLYLSLLCKPRTSTQGRL